MPIGAKMRRVEHIVHAGRWDADTAIDRVVLDAGDRHRRRAVLTGERGTTLLLDWPQPVLLKDGDGLMLSDGGTVAVVGKCEPLLELAAPSAAQLVRLAWHIGNRHADVQIINTRLRIRRDHVLQDMAMGLGAAATPIEAPFEPEAGRYRRTDRAGHGA